MTYVIYIAKCKDCKWKSAPAMRDWDAQMRAEEHMMETGHIADVNEVE